MNTRPEIFEKLTPKQRTLLALKAVQRKKADSLTEMIQPLLRLDSENQFPLSFGQRRLWFLEQYEKQNTRYNFCNVYRIKGHVSKEILEQALNAIIKRHEVWRTTFKEINGDPIQIISPELHIQPKYMELQTNSGHEIQQFILAEAETLFDLVNGPLVKATLIQTGESEYILLWISHHIVNDGWSIGVFVHELEEFYQHYLSGKEISLPDLPIQYADFAVWQQNWLTGAVMDKQLGYWKQKLGGDLPVLELPMDRIRQPIKTLSAHSVVCDLPFSLLEQIKELAKKDGVTTFMIHLAAFKVLLYRYTHQEDIIVGAPVTNRNRKELEHLIGFFVNTLAFRTQLNGELSFHELLVRVRETTLEAYEYQDIPFERLVDELHIKRDLSNSPIFQVMFVFENNPDPVPKLPGLSVTLYDLYAEESSYDLTLYLTESPAGLRVRFLYNTDIFNESTIQRLMKRFEIILGQVVADPSQSIAKIPVLLPEEHQKLIHEWNDTSVDFPQYSGIHQLFERQVSQFPEAIAVTFEGKSLTYRELNSRANQLGYYLRSLGVGPDSRVALLVERSLDIMIGLLGILKAGGAYVPIDPMYPKERIEYMLKESGSTIIITQSGFAAWLKDWSEFNLFSLDTEWPTVTNFRTENPDTTISSSNLAYIIFTSGSTGKPKGVAIKHTNCINYVQGLLRRLDDPSGLNFAIVTTFAADLGLSSLWGALCSGGRLHIISYERAADPEYFADYFRKNPIDVLKIVPSHFEALRVISNLTDVIPEKYLIFGGEASNWETVAKIKAVKPNCIVMNHYGPTETTVGMLTYKITDLSAKNDQINVPLGKPLPNTRAYILDEYFQPTPIGVPGELYISGHGVSAGYLNHPGQTAERFLPDPFAVEPGQTLYRTGDLARYLADGNIEFLGRVDTQVKIRGYRIEISEIELLLKMHSSLQDAVVLLREDKPGDKRLVAYVTPQGGQIANFNAAVVRDYLRQQLPDYMIPAAFIVLPVIPLNTNGKVDRLALPTPDPLRRETECTFMLPRTKLENNIAKIWSKVLDIQNIGIDDNFFDLGGDSFKAVKVVRNIRTDLRVIELFRNPTIRELAQFLTKESLRNTDLLHEFTKPVPAAERKISLVCFPYGGASAITFQPLANQLPTDYSLYAVEILGHDFSNPDEELVSLEETAQRCVAEIKQKITGPIALYGQCIGGAISLRVAYLLEESGISVEGVFMGGLFPSPRLSGMLFDFLAKLFPNNRFMSDFAYRDLLKAVGGLNDSFTPEETKFTIRSLRHDSWESEEYFTNLYRGKNIPKIKTSIICIVGSSDRTTEFYQERYLEWEDFSDSVNLEVIPLAGHYFHKYQTKELGEIIRKNIEYQQIQKNVTNPPVVEKQNLLSNAASERPKTKVTRPSMSLFMMVNIGQMISNIGSAFSGFTLGIWLIQRTKSVSEFAIMLLCSLLPTILLLPIAGAIADRADRRRIMILCDILSFTGIAMVFIMLINNSLQVWHIYLSSIIGSIAGSFRRPAFMAATAQITPKKYLINANGISQFAGAIGGLVAPACGGALLMIIQLKGILIIDLLTFIFAIVVLIKIQFPNSLFRKQEEPILKEIVGGWNYIVKRKSMLAMVWFFIAVNFLESSFDTLLTPLGLSFATPTLLGIIVAFQSLGILVGSTVLSIFGGMRQRAKAMVGFVILSGISTAFIGLHPSPAFAMIGLFGFGLALALVDTHWASLIQVKVGWELQGRVFAINQMLAWSMRPLSFMITGVLADRVFKSFMSGDSFISRQIGQIIGRGPEAGIGLMIIIEGIILVFWTIIWYQYRPLREMDEVLPDTIPEAIIVKDKDKLQELADRKVLTKIHQKGVVKNERSRVDSI
jgi:amino acid adenylation domain-containing protein